MTTHIIGAAIGIAVVWVCLMLIVGVMQLRH